MQAAFRQVLLEGDVAGLRALWAAHAPPGWTQPASDEEAALMLHRARTESEWVPFARRAWSHRWLCERGLPSGLPDSLRPRAERLYPRVVELVGISFNARSALLKPVAALAQAAACDAVADVYADDPHPDGDVVRGRIREARERTIRQLLGMRA